MSKNIKPTAVEWRRSWPRGLFFHLVRTEPVSPGYYSSDMLHTQLCNNERQAEEHQKLPADIAPNGQICCRECLVRIQGPAGKYYRMNSLPIDKTISADGLD